MEVAEQIHSLLNSKTALFQHRQVEEQQVYVLLLISTSRRYAFTLALFRSNASGTMLVISWFDYCR